MNYNRVIFGGRLTRDPQLKFLPSQMAVADFGLVENRKFKTKAGEEREDSTFVDCVAWGKTAELINQHFRKGKTILVEGRLKFEQWEDKQGGGKRSKLMLTVDSFQFVGPKEEGDGATSSRPGPRKSEPGPGPFDNEKTPEFKEDDIPF